MCLTKLICKVFHLGILLSWLFLKRAKGRITAAQGSQVEWVLSNCFTSYSLCCCQILQTRCNMGLGFYWEIRIRLSAWMMKLRSGKHARKLRFVQMSNRWTQTTTELFKMMSISIIGNGLKNWTLFVNQSIKSDSLVQSFSQASARPFFCYHGFQTTFTAEGPWSLS